MNTETAGTKKLYIPIIGSKYYLPRCDCLGQYWAERQWCPDRSELRCPIDTLRIWNDIFVNMLLMIYRSTLPNE